MTETDRRTKRFDRQRAVREEQSARLFEGHDLVVGPLIDRRPSDEASKRIRTVVDPAAAWTLMPLAAVCGPRPVASERVRIRAGSFRVHRSASR
ncbi:hypothetical protein [Methylobacterium brachiatum]